MRYFIVEVNPAYQSAPVIINWYGKFDVRMINPKEHHKLPKRKLLMIQNYKNTVFTDIITFPFLLVSEKVYDVIKIYEPRTPFKQIVLLDSVNQAAQLYYLPILAVCDCLSEKSELNLDKSVIRRAVIEPEETQDKSFFRIGGVKNAYYVMRLDLAESLLRRDVKGLGLKLVDICTNKSSKEVSQWENRMNTW